MLKMFSPLYKNFKILWDNAYACHDLKETISQTNASVIAKEFNIEDNIFHFGSTSKMTLAGSGISFLSSSKENLDKFIDYRNSVTVGPNKMNQGLHVEYFKIMPIKQQMQKMKEILLPKFEITDHYLTMLKDERLGSFSNPTGGYFFSYDSKNQIVRKLLILAKSLTLNYCHQGPLFLITTILTKRILE